MLEDQNYQVLGYRHDISIAYGAAQLTVEVLCSKSRLAPYCPIVALPDIEIWADFTCTITALYVQVDYFRARRHAEVEVSPRIGKG